MGIARLSLVAALSCCLLQSIAGKTHCSTVSCSSRSYRFTMCTVPYAADVKSVSVKKKMSRSDCTKQKSFGPANEQIWVNKGCRAEFDVCYTPGFVKTVSCSSWKYNPAKCATGIPPISKLVLWGKQSNSPCLMGISYGFIGSDIWVRNGCRATFKAYHFIR